MKLSIMLVMVGFVLDAVGAVAFTSLDGDKVPTSYQWTIVDGQALITTPADVGVQFSPAVSGSLESVTVAAVRKSYSLTPSEPRVWVVAGDAGGVPGDVIDSLSVVPPAKVENVVLRSKIKPVLTAGTRYWLLCMMHASNGNIDGWVSSDMKFNRAEFAKWPMVYRGKTAQVWSPFNGAIPAFKITVKSVVVAPPVVDPEPEPEPPVVTPPDVTPPVVAPPVVTPPVVTPPVVTPPVVTPPVVTPPVVTPPVVTPEPSVADLVAEIESLLDQISAVLNRIKSR